MRRSLVLVLGWLAATVAAVGISWAGVRLVAAKVVEPLPVAMDEITVEPSPAISPSASPSPEAIPSPEATPSPRGSSASSSDDSGTPGTDPEDGSEAPSEDRGAPAADAQPETRTYSLVGGTVTVEFSSTSVRVIQATPNSGFTREIDQEGATQIEVEFRSEDHRSRLEAWWAGAPQSDIDEDADRSGSDDD